MGKPGGSNRLTKNEFIDRSIEIHGDKYDYSRVDYINNSTKIIIICKNHGEFSQTPQVHLKGSGCSKCSESLGELRIRKYLEDKNIEYLKQKTFKGCNDIGRLRFDFYLTDYNLCIEFDGQQHYKPTKFLSNMDDEMANKKFIEQKRKDQIKTQYCLDNGIGLLRISYLEINKIEDILNQNI